MTQGLKGSEVMILGAGWRTPCGAVVVLLALLAAAAGAAGAADDVTMARKYPFLANGVLTCAHLVSLPEGVLARSGEVTVVDTDLRQAISDAAWFAREGLQRDPIPMLELVLERRLLAALARDDAARKGEPAADEEALVEASMARLAGEVRPDDAEVRAFYDHNQEACGRLPFEQVREYVEQLLTRRAREDRVREILRGLGRERRIEVSAAWVEAHAAAGLDNPIDRLRGKGKPVLAVFSAASCCGPDRMKPVLAEVEQAVGDAAEVVYIEARENQALAIRHRVAGIPTTLVFDAAGAESFRYQGLVTAELLRAAILPQTSGAGR